MVNSPPCSFWLARTEHVGASTNTHGQDTQQRGFASILQADHGYVHLRGPFSQSAYTHLDGPPTCRQSTIPFRSEWESATGGVTYQKSRKSQS